MANRYWVGGTGTWDTTTTHWSSTSGGASGASVPTSADNVFFDSNSSSASYSVAINTASTPACLALSISGPSSGTLTYGTTSYGVNVSGALTIAATGVSAANGYFYLLATTSTTITTNNVTIDTIECHGSTTYTLGSAFNGKVYIGTAGSSTTFNTGNFNVTCSAATASILGVSGATASIFTGGTSTLTFSGISSTFNATNMTSISAASCTFNFSGTNTVLAGNGFTYGTVNNAGSSKTFTISGSNTITTLANTVQPTTFKFTSGTTQTVTNFNVSGTSGNLVTIISSTSGTAATLSKASGTVSSNYLSIQDSTATGGAAWYAGANSTNVSGNTGWIFSAPATNRGNFLMFM